jgi:hypothetical protein
LGWVFEIFVIAPPPVLPHEDDAAGWCGPTFRELP